MTFSLVMVAAAVLQAQATQACPVTQPVIIAENFTLVLFESGSARLSAQALTLLEGWSQLIRGQHFPARVELTGGADRVGSRQANLRLSFRRAAAVRDYLVRSGIRRPQIRVSGFGEERPLVDTADGASEAQNRVVQLLMLMDPREPHC